MNNKCVCEESTEKLNHYICLTCNDKTIDFSITICKGCILEEHSDHQIVSLNKIFNKSIKKILSFERMFSYSKNWINKAEEEINSINKELDQILNRFQNYISMINEKIQALLETISEEKKEFDKYTGIMKDFQKIVTIKDVSSQKDCENIEFAKSENMPDLLRIFTHNCYLKKDKISIFENINSCEKSKQAKILDFYKLKINSLSEFLENSIEAPLFNIEELSNQLRDMEVKDLHYRKIDMLDIYKNITIKNIKACKNKLIIIAGDNIIRACNLENLKEIQTKELQQCGIRSLDIFNNIIAIGNDDSSIKLLKFSEDAKLSKNTLQLKEISIINANSNFQQKSYNYSLRFLPNNKIAAGRGQNDNYSIKIWDFQTKNCVETLKAHQNTVKCLLIIDELNIFISGADDGYLKIWDAISFNFKENIIGSERGQIISLIYNKHFRNIAFATDENKINIFEVHPFVRQTNFIKVKEKINDIHNVENLNLIALVSMGFFLNLFDWKKGYRVLIIPTSRIAYCLYSVSTKEGEAVIYCGEENGKVEKFEIYN